MEARPNCLLSALTGGAAVPRMGGKESALPTGTEWTAPPPAGYPYRAFRILGRRSGSPLVIRDKSRMR